MATVTISLPDPMKDWIEAQAGNGQFSGVSDYIRDLVRQDQYRKDQREALVQALIEGEESGPAQERTRAELRAEARRRVVLKHDE
ncbi:MAG TPA: type II toxin-antitoxin system ParD family antitoxin [Rhodospirillaceae bacterium]|nr:type II toxin-antitoxin system ParD family antitoxin [Rhodospirillaceae bacterium]MAX63041.1 type II toxin-antitoxin system ParD family antitoxin [Rhodospirillaceae bacterium]MBB57889.1 type II toxin-antitoxin system ParD family antitoxin [Rhodospirillaceae bacterium]HAE00811.1 type II toxin-antitoxin system ParD family antitoxin [Rhodospirillaceae bacterium]HBM14539.1 type II toxin-antitoxin system ParD family antitoxin [Rhodospirillaceae bacterium]|tara:strand:- start:547 stop:801 length:255 start_codon:yes stop_codon:yes gene_type:complete